MKIYIAIFLSLFLFSSCYSPQVNDGKIVVDENGNVAKELNVEKTCSLVRGVMGISLPLAIEKGFKDKQQRINHVSTVLEAISEVLDFLGDSEKEKTLESVREVVKIFGQKLTNGERSAIQSAINLILHAIKEHSSTDKQTGNKALKILHCLFDEAKNIFTLYSKEEPVVPKEVKNLEY